MEPRSGEPTPGESNNDSRSVKVSSRNHPPRLISSPLITKWLRAPPTNVPERLLNVEHGKRVSIREHRQLLSRHIKDCDDFLTGEFTMDYYADDNMEDAWTTPVLAHDLGDNQDSLFFAYAESSLSTQSTCRGPAGAVVPSTKQADGEYFRELVGWFRQWLAESFRSRHPEERSSSGSPKQATSSSKAAASRTELQKRLGKRCQRPDESDDEREDRGGGTPWPSKRSKAHHVGLMFACPYFKHNWVNHKACATKGYPAVRYLKEHLYRCHILPQFRCHRCYLFFDDESSLSNHARSQYCSLQEPPATEQDGISPTQLTELRKRSRNNVSELSRWNEVYLILFPGQEANIPCPYAGLSQEQVTLTKDPVPTAKTQLHDDLHDMEQFFIRACPRHLAQHLEAPGHPLNAALTPSDKLYLINMIPGVMLSLSREYHAWRSEFPGDVASSETPISGFPAADSKPDKGATMNTLLCDTAESETPIFHFPELPIPPDIDRSLAFLSSQNLDAGATSFEDFVNPPEKFLYQETDYTSAQLSALTLNSDYEIGEGPLSSMSSFIPPHANDELYVNSTQEEPTPTCEEGLMKSHSYDPSVDEPLQINGSLPASGSQ